MLILYSVHSHVCIVLSINVSVQRTHQQSRSQNASTVPDLDCDVFRLHGRPPGEEEQDVTQHTHDRQRYQTDPQTLGKAA